MACLSSPLNATFLSDFPHGVLGYTPRAPEAAPLDAIRGDHPSASGLAVRRHPGDRPPHAAPPRRAPAARAQPPASRAAGSHVAADRARPRGVLETRRAGERELRESRA